MFGPIYEILIPIDQWLSLYRVTTINVSRIWIELAEWAAMVSTANSPFPGHVYCRLPVCPFWQT